MEGCVQQSDTKNMPQLLDHVSDARENEASRHFAISLYAELAQVHKQAIIPYIPRMMASIVRALPFSADTQQLHQACAKAVASVARYTIDPTRPYDSNQQILFNLCSPLLPVLASKLESSAAGAAICLQAVVESEKWKYAHPDLQGLICSKATAALEEQGAHTVAFLHLVKSLAKFSRDASHWHVAEWFRIGLQVLQADSGMAGSWQQRVAAAQLIAIILKTADVDQLGLDLHATTKILEAHLMDKVTVVQIAVAEALETVKGVALEERMHRELPVSSCESKRRNSDTEESGLSGSTSSRSGTSSREAVPSMASSTVKFGMGPKRSSRRSIDSSCRTSHASLSLSLSSKLKENTPATLPRQVLSEIPASGKLLSNLEVLRSSCPSKPLRRSSVDLGSKVGNSEVLPSSSPSKPLRRSSVDLGSKVGKLLRNSEVLPSSCPSKPLRRSSVDLGSDYLMQDKVSFGSGKSIQCVHNRIHDCAMKTSSPARKHVEGCHNFSNAGCTCSLDNEEDGTNNHLASTDHLSAKADSEIVEEHDDCVEEDMHRLPINSKCRRGCANDDCVAGVPSSGCTGDGLSGKDTSKGASSESLTAAEMGGHLKVEKPHVLREEFAFRAPGSLMPSLQSSSSTKRRVKSCKKCKESDLHLPKEASWTGSDVQASGESEESQVVSTDSDIRDETCGASCTSEDLNDRTFKSGSCIHRRSLQKINDTDGKRMSVELNDCEIHASGQDLLCGARIHRRSLQKINDIDGTRMPVELNDCEIHASGQDSLCGTRIHRRSLQKINDIDGPHMSVELNDCEIHASGQDSLSSRESSDGGIGDDDEKVANRQSGNLHRSLNKSGPRKHFTAQMEGHNKLPAGPPDSKSRVVDHSGEGSVLSEVFKKQICAGTLLGFACAVGVLVLAVMVIRHLNQIYDSHALVPT